VQIFGTSETQLQIQPSMTYMVQMILSKPLFIIVWMYQEMMRWLRRLLNGFVVGLERSFGSNIEATDEICFDFDETHLQLHLSMTQLAQITLSKHLLITSFWMYQEMMRFWMYQEMMRWPSRLLNGVMVDLGWILAQKYLWQKNTFFDESQPQIQPSMTHMAQMC
jgi:hypothetical protein